MEIPFFEAILNWIDKWGFPLVLLILVLWWLRQKADDVWRRFVLRDADFEERFEDAIASILDRHIERLSEIDGEIGSIMYKVLDKMGSQWCTLWQYHNGDYNLAGSPFFRVSATHQKFVPGKEGWAHNYLRLPISLLFPPSQIKDGCNPILPGEYDDLGTTNIMKYNDVETMWICKIENGRGVHIGNLTVCWDKKVEYDEEKCKILYGYASRIQALLEVLNQMPKTREEMKIA